MDIKLKLQVFLAEFTCSDHTYPSASVAHDGTWRTQSDDICERRIEWSTRGVGKWTTGIGAVRPTAAEGLFHLKRTAAAVLRDPGGDFGQGNTTRRCLSKAGLER